MKPDSLKLKKAAHANFCKRFLFGIPGSFAEADSSRVAIGFYCLGALDILGLLESKTQQVERDGWREWIWDQQVRSYAHLPSPETGGDEYVGGFRPSPFMRLDGFPGLQMHDEPDNDKNLASTSDLSTDPPHLIMTYTAILSLAILRDDFSRLDRAGVRNLLRATQQSDGSFTATPGQGEADVRMVYTAFAICSMLDDWSAIDVDKAIGFVRSCYTYEGGFGQYPGNEATGGPTYCCLACLHLVPEEYTGQARLTDEQRQKTTRWLVQNQREAGGFCGRTEKVADACYSFWCGAALKILEKDRLVEGRSNAHFLFRCQANVGGFGKEPDDRPDPYHTFLSLASLALLRVKGDGFDESWELPPLDPLLNATEETATWAREHLRRI